MPALPKKATGTLGARANSTANRRRPPRPRPASGRPAPMSRAASRVAIGGPDRQARADEDLDRGDRAGRWTSVEVEGLLVLQRGQRGEARRWRRPGRAGRRRSVAARRSSTPVRQASPEGRRGLGGTAEPSAPGGRCTRHVARGTAVSAPDASICRLSCSCSCRPRRARAGACPPAPPPDGHGEDEERRPPRRRRPGPPPRITPIMAPRRHPGRWAEYTRGPHRDRVVVGQQRVVGGEDHRLAHADAGTA